jgi:protoporphyrinogen oxidase
MNNIVLGAGIAGLGAAYSLRNKGECAIVIEQEDTYGGLCGNFTIRGFRFDRFVHFDFTQSEEAYEIFKKSSPEIHRHESNPFNIYKGKWIKHPAQNNLYPLSEEEKKAIISDLMSRPSNVNMDSIENFEQWLRFQFGNYFAEHFPMRYTRKYWMNEARDLETKWLNSKRGSRLYQPSIEEVIHGCKTTETPVTYYSKEMRYPKKGGFKSFLKILADGAEIRYKHILTAIDPKAKTYTCKTPEGYITENYDRLISSLPLPIMIEAMGDSVPQKVQKAAHKLRCTSGYQVSIGLKTKNIPPYLWWYIYDEDILPARVYSPSLKSPDNVPEGCSSLQLEIYCTKGKYTEEDIIRGSVERLCDLNIINREDILFTDIRFEPFANVIFDHNVYECRDKVRGYLKAHNIDTIGRFGEWEYYWTDQSLLSGLNIK